MDVVLSAVLQRANEITRATSHLNNEFFNATAKHTRSTYSCNISCSVCYQAHLI